MLDCFGFNLVFGFGVAGFVTCLILFVEFVCLAVYYRLCFNSD